MKTPTAPALPDTPAELLRAVKAEKKAADETDLRLMRLGVHWADLHLADPEHAEACFTSSKTFAGEGSPSIDEFCVPEFAAMLGRTNDSAGRFLTECVEVAYRLPQLWGAVQAGLVAGWRARLIAQTLSPLRRRNAGSSPLASSKAPRKPCSIRSGDTAAVGSTRRQPWSSSQTSAQA